MSGGNRQHDKAYYEQMYKQQFQSAERVPQVAKQAQSNMSSALPASSSSQLVPAGSRFREDIDARTVDLSSILASPAPRKALMGPPPVKQTALTTQRGPSPSQKPASSPRKPRKVAEPWVNIYGSGSDIDARTLDLRSMAPTPAAKIMQLRPETPAVRHAGRAADHRHQFQTSSQPRRGSVDTARPPEVIRPQISLDEYYENKKRRRASSDAPRVYALATTRTTAVLPSARPRLNGPTATSVTLPTHSRSRSDTPHVSATAAHTPHASISGAGASKAHAPLVVSRHRAPLPGQWVAGVEGLHSRQHSSQQDTHSRPTLNGAATVPQANLPQARPLYALPPPSSSQPRTQARPPAVSAPATRAVVTPRPATSAATQPTANGHYTGLVSVHPVTVQRSTNTEPRRASVDHPRDASRTRADERSREPISAARAARRAEREASRERPRNESTERHTTGRDVEKSRARDRDRDIPHAPRPRRHHSADRTRTDRPDIWMRDSFNPLLLPPGDHPLPASILPPRKYTSRADKPKAGPPPASRMYPSDISKEVSATHSRQRRESTQSAYAAPVSAPRPMRALAAPTPVRAIAHPAAPHPPPRIFAGESRIKEEFDAKTLTPSAFSNDSGPRSASAPPDRPDTAAGNKLRKRPPLKLKLSDGGPTSPPMLSPTSPASADEYSNRGTHSRGFIKRLLLGRGGGGAAA
ncbi:hypothetical protein PENSPDRAFT_694852 [Peniophora sp. CONT]|nr:hypothetical protein PENSPDRAFT_694852 [Peniophora sp. CONT]